MISRQTIVQAVMALEDTADAAMRSAREIKKFCCGEPDSIEKRRVGVYARQYVARRRAKRDLVEFYYSRNA
jgi:hypothetical protein